MRVGLVFERRRRRTFVPPTSGQKAVRAICANNTLTGRCKRIGFFYRRSLNCSRQEPAGVLHVSSAEQFTRSCISGRDEEARRRGRRGRFLPRSFSDSDRGIETNDGVNNVGPDRNDPRSVVNEQRLN